MSDMSDLLTEIDEISNDEKALAKAMDALKTQHPDVFVELDKLSARQKEVDTRKSKLKSRLEKAKDYDVYDTKVARVSLTEIVRIDVDDIEKVPTEYKENKVVANIKKAENHFRLYGNLPEGFINKSYSRLNWRNKE